MRVLLFSCLLIGSITCGPVDKEYGENSAGASFLRQPFSSGNRFSGPGVSSNPIGSSLLPNPPQPGSDSLVLPAPQDPISSAGPGLYHGTNVAVGNSFGSVQAPGGSHAGGYDGSASGGYGFDSSAPGGTYASGYDSSGSAGYGFDSGSPGGNYASGYDSSGSAGYGFDSSAPGGSYVGGYDSSASVGYGFDSSAPGGSYVGGYDSSASVGYGFDSSAAGGSYVGGYDSSASAGYGFDSSAAGGSFAGGYDGSRSAYVGDVWSSGPSYGYDGTDELEPVFSDVSDLEPVYAFSSRSNYLRGRAVFAQTRYTPEEPVPQRMPARRVISKTSKQSSPKASKKGAF